MDFLRIAARIAAQPTARHAAALPEEALNAWHSQVIKPLRSALNAASGMTHITGLEMAPDHGAAAAKAVQDFVAEWGPKVAELTTGIGAVAKSVGDAAVRSRK